METHDFRNSAEFINWTRRIVKGAYDRAPVGKQTWTYGDGHVAETTWGERKGTMLSNLGYILSIIDGKLDGPRDAMLVKDIDARGGPTLSVDWGEQCRAAVYADSEGKGAPLIGIRLPPDELARIDNWIARQKEPLSRPVAIRRLVVMALARKGR